MANCIGRLDLHVLDVRREAVRLVAVGESDRDVFGVALLEPIEVLRIERDEVEGVELHEILRNHSRGIGPARGLSARPGCVAAGPRVCTEIGTEREKYRDGDELSPTGSWFPKHGIVPMQ